MEGSNTNSNVRNLHAHPWERRQSADVFLCYRYQGIRRFLTSETNWRLSLGYMNGLDAAASWFYLSVRWVKGAESDGWKGMWWTGNSNENAPVEKQKTGRSLRCIRAQSCKRGSVFRHRSQVLVLFLWLCFQHVSHLSSGPLPSAVVWTLACVWVEAAFPGMGDLCVNAIFQPKMTEIPVKTVAWLARSTRQGGGVDRTRGPDRGWDQWWLGWYTAGLLNRPYTVWMKPPHIQPHLEQPAWERRTILGSLCEDDVKVWKSLAEETMHSYTHHTVT